MMPAWVRLSWEVAVFSEWAAVVIPLRWKPAGLGHVGGPLRQKMGAGAGGGEVCGCSHARACTERPKVRWGQGLCAAVDPDMRPNSALNTASAPRVDGHRPAHLPRSAPALFVLWLLALP